jgi:hypothetical protein
MRYAIIKPADRSAQLVDAENGTAALRLAGLTPGSTDDGTVRRASPVRSGISLIVSELGLFVPPEHQSYFALEGYPHLCAGPAVLYGWDTAGKTVDLPDVPHVTWLPDRAAVERAIAEGQIIRPHVGADDDVIWRWPGPRPSEGERKRIMQLEPGHAMIVDGDTIVIALPPEKK